MKFDGRTKIEEDRREREVDSRESWIGSLEASKKERFHTETDP